MQRGFVDCSELARDQAIRPTLPYNMVGLVQRTRDAETITPGGFQTGVDPLDLLGNQPIQEMAPLQSEQRSLEKRGLIYRTGSFAKGTPSSASGAVSVAAPFISTLMCPSAATAVRAP